MYSSILITTDALILSFYLAFSYIFSYHVENINDDRIMMWWKGRYNDVDNNNDVKWCEIIWWCDMIYIMKIYTKQKLRSMWAKALTPKLLKFGLYWILLIFISKTVPSTPRLTDIIKIITVRLRNLLKKNNIIKSCKKILFYNDMDMMIVIWRLWC